MLAGTGAMHASGYGTISALLAEAGIKSAWGAGIRALWLVFSLHLFIVAAILIVAALRPRSAGRGILLLCGLMPAIDTAVLLGFVGIFVGTVALGLAALLIFGATALRPSQEGPSEIGGLIPR